MRRSLSTGWILLLAMLLGGSPRTGLPSGGPAGTTALRQARAAGALEAYYLRAVTRPYHTVETRSPARAAVVTARRHARKRSPTSARP